MWYNLSDISSFMSLLPSLTSSRHHTLNFYSSRSKNTQFPLAASIFDWFEIECDGERGTQQWSTYHQQPLGSSTLPVEPYVSPLRANPAGSTLFPKEEWAPSPVGSSESFWGTRDIWVVLHFLKANPTPSKDSCISASLLVLHLIFNHRFALPLVARLL